MRISKSASTKPRSGENTIAKAVGPSPLQTMEPSPAFANPAPTNPPMSACELLEGSPAHHVIRFQTIAPMRAPNTTRASVTSGDTRPVPTVLATFSPKNRNAMKLKKEAQATAQYRGNMRVETTVAMELAASCSPLMKSKARATKTSPIRSGKARVSISACPPNLIDRIKIYWQTQFRRLTARRMIVELNSASPGYGRQASGKKRKVTSQRPRYFAHFWWQ